MIVRVTRDGREIVNQRLDADPMTVGRGASAGICLDHQDIPAKGLELHLKDDAIRIRALEASSPFQYRGEDASEILLSAGESVELGPYSLNFISESHPADAKAPPPVDISFSQADDAMDDALGEALGQLFGDEDEEGGFWGEDEGESTPENEVSFTGTEAEFVVEGRSAEGEVAATEAPSEKADAYDEAAEIVVAGQHIATAEDGAVAVEPAAAEPAAAEPAAAEPTEAEAAAIESAEAEAADIESVEAEAAERAFAEEESEPKAVSEAVGHEAVLGRGRNRPEDAFPPPIAQEGEVLKEAPWDIPPMGAEEAADEWADARAAQLNAAVLPKGNPPEHMAPPLDEQSEEAPAEGQAEAGDAQGAEEDGGGAASDDMAAAEDGALEAQGESKRESSGIEAALAALGPQLLLLDGEQSLKLSDRPIFIGAAEGMDFRVEGPGVARRHAAILHEGGFYVLKDLQSPEGTTVGQKAIGAWRLRNGEEIGIGGVRLEFRWPAQPAEQLQGMQLLEHDKRGDDELSPPPRFGRALWAAALFIVLAAGAGAYALWQPSGPVKPTGAALESIQSRHLARQNQQIITQALWQAGRYQAILDFAASQAAAAGAVDPFMAQLAQDAREAQSWERLRRQLWMRKSKERGRHVQTSLLMAEGRVHIRRAEEALRLGLPLEPVNREAEAGRRIIKEAQRLSPRHEKAVEALNRIAQLVGMAKVREDNQNQRFERENLQLLVDISQQALENHDYLLAERVLRVIMRRAEAAEGEIKGQAEADLAALDAVLKNRASQLMTAAANFEAAGDLLSARALYATAESLVNEKERKSIREQLTQVNQTLRERARSALATGREHLESDGRKQAEQRFWQVLEYAPDWSDAIHRSARAELEKLARAR